MMPSRKRFQSNEKNRFGAETQNCWLLPQARRRIPLPVDESEISLWTNFVGLDI
jgi:hypothetical protein